VLITLGRWWWALVTVGGSGSSSPFVAGGGGPSWMEMGVLVGSGGGAPL
jgi:hypothetical protein